MIPNQMKIWAKFTSHIYILLRSREKPEGEKKKKVQTNVKVADFSI